MQVGSSADNCDSSPEALEQLKGKLMLDTTFGAFIMFLSATFVQKHDVSTGVGGRALD